MKLEIASFPVHRIVMGESTRYSDGELRVDPDEIRGRVLDEKYFDDVIVHVAHPGDSTRIIHAVDVVEPRYKESGPGCVFPGVLGPPSQVGEGKTVRLNGMTVMSVAEPAAGENYYWREAIVDMSGLGAQYSPFSETANLILEFSLKEPGPEVHPQDLEVLNTLRGSKYSQQLSLALRHAQFGLASYLAEKVLGLGPYSVDTYELTEVDASLPKVVYGCQILGEFVYGAQTGWQPTLIHPNEFMDGVVFRPFTTPASIRNTAYHELNHPIIHHLYDGHGKELNFLGVLLIPAGPEGLTEKERATGFAAKLLDMLRADGVVLTWLGGGHMAMDPMLLIQKCEELGIKTALLNPEMARTPGDSGFVYFVPEADAIVSTGNYEREIKLPKVDKVIGGDAILVTGADPGSELTVGIGQMLGSTHTFGPSRLTGVAY